MATPATLLAACEAVRRCKTDPSIKPTTPDRFVHDYATACAKIDIAKSHLDEALPNRQRERVLAAMVALREGVLELEQYLVSVGYCK